MARFKRWDDYYAATLAEDDYLNALAQACRGKSLDEIDDVLFAFPDEDTWKAAKQAREDALAALPKGIGSLPDELLTPEERRLLGRKL